jgi:zinc protease
MISQVQTRRFRRRVSVSGGLIAMVSAVLLTLPVNRLMADGNEPVLQATLKNGLRVVIVPDRLAAVATTVLNYRVGSNEAPEGFPGMAHAQEHMMFRGSPGLSAEQLASIAANMGGEFNADTQQAVTQYFFTVPAEDLDVALHVEAVRMRSVLDSEPLWTQERDAIDQEVAQDLSNPEYLLYSKLLASLFRGTPYAHDALGTRASFQKTTADMLKQFHEAWYAPNNAVLVVAGDVQPQKTLAQIVALFADTPARRLPKRPEIHLQPMMPDMFEFTTDLPEGISLISFRMPGSDSADYAPARVLADVLNSQRGDLYSLVAEGKALSTSFVLNGLPSASLGYVAGTFPKDGNGAALQRQIRKVLAGYIQNGFPTELVEAAKRHEMTEAELRKNSVPGLAMAWSRAVAVEGRRSPDDELRATERVTVADVNRVARSYLRLDDAVTAILKPEYSGKPAPAEPFDGPESLTSKHPAIVALPAWAAKSLDRISIPPSSVNPVVTKLPNGIELIVQPETISKTVSVYGHVRNNADLETPPGQEGVAEVLDQLFSFGSTSRDRLSFAKALDDIGANESAGADFSLQVLTSQFDRGVQLLADNELHPALPEREFMTVQQELAGSVKGRLESPDYLAGHALRKLLFPEKDPTLRQATAETVSALSLADVKKYYERVFRPDLTTIVVMGEVTPHDAQDVIQKYFGEWKASGPEPPTVLPAVPLNKPSFTTVPDKSRVQDKVILGETLGLNRFHPDYYALELGNHVLGGGFYATRLYRDLRENGGLVYSVSSTLEIGRTRGLYLVRFACDPMNVWVARGIIEHDLKQMQMSPVTPEELQQAKAMLVREIPLAESSVGRIAAGMISRTTEGLPLDEPTRAAHHYVQLDGAQVREAFAKWLRVEDLVQVTQGPPPK